MLEKHRCPVVLSVCFLSTVFFFSPVAAEDEGTGPGAERLFFEARGIYSPGVTGAAFQDYPSALFFTTSCAVSPESLPGSCLNMRLPLLAENPWADFKGRGGELTVEYSLTRWLGLGLFWNRTWYRAQSAPSLGPVEYMSALVATNAPSLMAKNYSAWQDLIVQLDVYRYGIRRDFTYLNPTTAGMSLYLHLPWFRRVDPYFRVFDGTGTEPLHKEYVMRAGGGIGGRYFFSDHVYASFEAGEVLSRYRGPHTSGRHHPVFDLNDFLNLNQPRGHLDEKYVSLGIGYSLYVPFRLKWPSLKTEERRQPADVADDSAAGKEGPLETPEENRAVQELHSLKGQGLLDYEIVDGKIRIVLPNDLVFDPGSDQLDARGEATVRRVAVALKAMKGWHFDIEGHTDSTPITGSRFSTNWDLASARAIRVLGILAKEGISESALAAISYGPNRPLQSNDTEAGRRSNRRIEIKAVKRIKGSSEGK